MIIRKQHGLSYLTKLSEEAVKVKFKSGVELYELQTGKQKWCVKNIQPRKALPLLIASVHEDKYWIRYLQSDHMMSSYRQYIKQNRLYILFNDFWKDRVRREREKEEMGYYRYNKIRELQLAIEVLESGRHKDDGYRHKIRSMNQMINNLKQKKK